MTKKSKADAMMLNVLDGFKRFGISGIQIGNTTLRKRGKSTLEITTRKRVRR